MHWTDESPQPYRGAVTDTVTEPPAATGSVVVPPATLAVNSTRGRVEGVALILMGSATNQIGAAAGAMAFPVIGPAGVVAVRQMITAVVLGVIVRPRFRTFTRRQWWPILGLALSFSVMNFCLYTAVERIGLGLAVTLEFLGPLAVAIFATRRAVEIGCAVIAAVGVIVLTKPGPTTDVVGIGAALVAAAAWAGYILVNRSVGHRLPGLTGTAAASVVTAVAWVPIAVVWFSFHAPTLTAILLACVCGILSSTIPYAADLLALRRLPAGAFSTLSSFHPVAAAFAGWILLGQALALNEWIGIGLIVASNALVSVRAFGAQRV